MKQHKLTITPIEAFKEAPVSAFVLFCGGSSKTHKIVAGEAFEVCDLDQSPTGWYERKLDLDGDGEADAICLFNPDKFPLEAVSISCDQLAMYQLEMAGVFYAVENRSIPAETPKATETSQQAA